MENQKIKMYGASWCGDCVRAKYVFQKYNIDYEYIDIDRDDDAVAFVENANNGMRSIPLIIFPDGRKFVEPSNDELTRALGY